MARSGYAKMIERGIRIADSKMVQIDKVWSRYSNDKVEIGEGLALLIRILSKGLPLARPMSALSIGSSAEPQFRILESAFRGHLCLLDVEKEALEIVQERIRRQFTTHVTTVRGDYNKIFLDARNTVAFLKKKLGGERPNLITLHHSLYYSDETKWHVLFDNFYRKILAPKGIIHAVLMAAETGDPYTTTWLFNHFAGKFFGDRNNQNLLKFMEDLRHNPHFKSAWIVSRPHRVRFFVDDFEKFMAVIWMILLYPNVYRYSSAQKEEITELVYKRFWLPKKPLIQYQDHLVIARGLSLGGLAWARR